jgi:hypothetical protein
MGPWIVSIFHYTCISNKMQRYTVYLYLETALTYFGWYFHPSSGAHTTVSTAYGICHIVTAICRYRGRVGTGLSVLALIGAHPILHVSRIRVKANTTNTRQADRHTCTIHPNATFATLWLLSSFALAAKQSVAECRATGDISYCSSCIQCRFYVRSKIWLM